jgi:PBP1b-binding outer membrane lipoprotein LpoB
MKHILITTIAAVVLVGCGQSQQSVPQAEAKPVKKVYSAAGDNIDRVTQTGPKLSLVWTG